MKARRFLPVLLLLSSLAVAKQPTIVTWPESGEPVLRFTIGKLSQIASVGREGTYTAEVTVENLSHKPVKTATFDVYAFDKKSVRVGDGYLNVEKLGAGQTARLSITIRSMGAPATITLSAAQPSVKTIEVRVYSVPAGASLSVDGQEVGVTPKLVEFTVGDHMLEFAKEGYAPGKFPFNVGPRDLSGGTVSFELGTLARDTIELRDGTVLIGDLQSISATEVVVLVNGKERVYERNLVKRVLLVERDPAPTVSAK